MDRKIQILIVAGILATIIAFIFSIYAAGIVFIILIVLVMSMLIMNDTAHLPDIVAELSDDAKAVILRNNGNTGAVKIHVALVPQNIEFDIPSLGVEERYTHPVQSMIQEVKAVITFENEQGNHFSRTYKLSSCGESFEPLRPMIPIFGWK